MKSWVIKSLAFVMLILNVSCAEKPVKNELTEFESFLKSVTGSKIITGEYRLGWNRYYLTVCEKDKKTIELECEENDDVSIVNRYKAFVAWENYQYDREKRNISFYNRGGLIVTLHFEEGLSFSVVEWGAGMKETSSSQPEDLDNPEIKSFQELFEKYFADAERIYIR